MILNAVAHLSFDTFSVVVCKLLKKVSLLQLRNRCGAKTLFKLSDDSAADWVLALSFGQEGEEKYAIFWSFSARSDHTYNHRGSCSKCAGFVKNNTSNAGDLL